MSHRRKNVSTTKVIVGIFIKLIIIVVLGVFIINNYPNLKKNMEWILYRASSFIHGSDMPDGVKVENKDELVMAIWDGMMNRETELNIVYNNSFHDIEAELQEINQLVMDRDDKNTSSDGDYLQYICGQYQYEGSYTNYFSQLQYTFTYIESKEETDQVDNKIQELLASWDIPAMSDYEKIKKIHDYIISHVTYDLTHNNYSAYDAMFEQKAVCQGYALLAYKMFLEAGISCRIIGGTADNETHAWNIVKLDGKWYNVDCTWDDPITADGEELDEISYQFFLKGEDDFNDHIREKQQDTQEFHREYPMAQYGYQ